MANQERFRFDLSDEETEPAAQDEELKKRLNRLSQRMSFLTLLLPCLLAIVVYVAYHDLTQRLLRTRTSEIHSVERLAQDIEQRMASLTAIIASQFRAFFSSRAPPWPVACRRPNKHAPSPA